MGQVVKKQQCPECMDTGKDNLAVYDDNSTYCFACGYTDSPTKKSSFIAGEIVEIKSRGLSSETCKFFDYQIGKHNGKYVHIANYKNQKGKTIAQKIRYKDLDENSKKKMFMTGDAKNVPLYGQWLWSPNDKLFITVVEGEIDALTVAQVQGYQYPVVSVPKGAKDARKSIEANLKYLLGFKYVVLAFDNDTEGQAAVQSCAELFEPGKVRIATWLDKDPNEMLLNGKSQEIKQSIFAAKEIIPEAIVSVSSIIDKVLIKPTFGIDYPWSSMTDITYGLQMGEIHIIVASTGVGKTEFVKDIMFHLLDKDLKIGLFSFEQSPDNTIRRLVGAKLGLKLHLPGVKWNEKEIRTTAESFNDKIYLYDRAGRVNTNDVFNSIRFLSKSRDVRLFIIDNIKALGIANNNDDAALFMNQLKALMKELNTTCFLLSHVAKDKFNYSTYVTTSPKDPDSYNSKTAEENDEMVKKPGLEWESGRMPTVNNVEGSNIICALADYVFGLARNSTSTDQLEYRTMRVKALKCRLDSSKTGKTFKLLYTDEGHLKETDAQIVYNKIEGF
jgi:twinkle protein